MSANPGELQQQINEFWNERAASAQGAPHHAITGEQQRQAWLGALAPLLPPAPADVLDVGTGTGFLAFLLADLGHHVTGIDLSEGMLNDARALASMRGNAAAPLFKTGDAMDPPLAASSLDVVTNRNVTWTLLDPRRALRNWSALLRPGGRVVAVHHRTMRVGANTPYPVQTALPPLPDATTGEPVVTTNDARFSDSLMILLSEAGFVDARIVELTAIDAVDAELGSDHLGWLAVTAIRPR
jgi:SAM-dependent methyltransferase